MPLLKKVSTPFGTIRITRDRHGTLAYYQNGSFHSQTNKNGVSICAYVHAIYQIVRQKKSSKVLIIGCGGGSLATMLSRIGCDVTVVDINPVAFTLARDYFKMPLSVKCVQADGIVYVQKTKHRYNVIIIDVFGANNIVPKVFTTKAFFSAAAKILRRGGNLIMNTMLNDDADLRGEAIAGNMFKAGLPTTLLDWPGDKDRNMLIAGGPLRGVVMPSGKVPAWMRRDFKGLVKRKFVGF